MSHPGWSDENTCVVHDVRMYIVSGEDVCCSVVCGTLVGVLCLVLCGLSC